MRDDVSRAAFGLLLAYGIALGLPGPAVPSLQAAFDLDHRGAALHLTLFSLGALGGSAAAGRLGRTVTRRVLVRGALLGLALGGALVAVAPAAPVSLLGTATMGLFGIVAVNVGQGVLGERHGARSAAALSDGHVVSALGLAAAALAVAVARAVDAGGGWRIAFLAPAVAIVALLLARQPDRLPHREPDRATDGATDGATGGATGDAVPASPPAAPASPPGAHRAAASPPGGLRRGVPRRGAPRSGRHRAVRGRGVGGHLLGDDLPAGRGGTAHRRRRCRHGRRPRRARGGTGAGRPAGAPARGAPAAARRTARRPRRVRALPGRPGHRRGGRGRRRRWSPWSCCARPSPRCSPSRWR